MSIDFLEMERPKPAVFSVGEAGFVGLRAAGSDANDFLLSAAFTSFTLLPIRLPDEFS